MDKTYKVVRFYQNGRRSKVQAKNLTLDQAQKWCNDDETSSKTARKPNGCGDDEKCIERWNEKQKHWFDGYTEQ
ncbi:MAG: hypothetical protein ACR2FM_05060 [Candidatus Saccharimonadales bacterium]